MLPTSSEDGIKYTLYWLYSSGKLEEVCLMSRLCQARGLLETYLLLTLGLNQPFVCFSLLLRLFGASKGLYGFGYERNKHT